MSSLTKEEHKEGKPLSARGFVGVEKILTVSRRLFASALSSPRKVKV